MTEAEWLAACDRQPMLESFRSQFDNRRLRLFACACCRHAEPMLSKASLAALSTAELYADGLLSEVELSRAQQKVMARARDSYSEAVWFATDTNAFDAAFTGSFSAAGQEACFGWPGVNDNNQEEAVKNHAVFAAFLRDIFGNPFRPVTFDPNWRTSTAVSLARSMYESRDFSLMPILGDALQDAGCNSKQVIEHCRGKEPHVRGCWVVDFVLGKCQ